MPITEPVVNRQGHASYGDDEGAFVTFFKHIKKGKSLDYIEIIFPADTRSITRRAVKDADKERFSRKWEAYQKGESVKEDGYPLEQWSSMDEGTVREYNHHKIFTVEQLANLKETSLDNLGLGARTLHTKAKAFVAANKDSKVAEKYAAQNEALTKQVEDLSKIVKEQSLKLDALEKANKKKK